MKIAIFGKLANLNWGLESLLSKHQDRARVPMGLYDDDDLPMILHDDTISHIVSLQGRRIDRNLLRRYKAKKVLWNAEFLPYPGFENDPDALARLHAIEPLDDFDLVLNGCPLSTQWLRETRGVSAHWFPMMGVDPLIHRRIGDIHKDIDVGFYGAPNERRARIFRNISETLLPRGKTVHWTSAWGEDLIRFINRCKIVLNLHFTDQLNTESRVYEVLGCRTACLSEPLSATDMLGAGKHLELAEGIEEMVEGIDFLLGNPEYRERIAVDGYEYVHGKFNILNVLNMLVNQCEGA